MMEKLNCWEFKKCGREPDGKNVAELGVCPAATETGLDGIHGGRNSGRACWVIAGSMCDGKVQGTYAQKNDNCKFCDFYKKVEKEESAGFIIATNLLNLLRESAAESILSE